MTKYREILRLTAFGLSLRDIEKSLKVSKKTVVKVQKHADELSLSWPLNESLTDAELEQQMFPKDLSSKSTKRMPDFDYIRKELLKNGVCELCILVHIHTPVSGTGVASDNSFVRRCHSHPSSFWPTGLSASDCRSE